MTVSEAARQLEVSCDTIRRAIADPDPARRLAAARFGRGRGALRVTQEDLDDYRRRCAVVVDDAPPPAPAAGRRKNAIPDVWSRY